MVLAVLRLSVGRRLQSNAAKIIERGLGLTELRSRRRYGVGYPVGHTAVIGWFSKAMKNRPQGMLMGLFASAGSLARIVFPICTGLVADSFGSDAVFATLATLLGATLCVLVAYRADFREAIA